MDLLESFPLEALVFSYPITAASSLWTWLAFLTAAVGFWHIRSVVSKSDASPVLCPDEATKAQPREEQPQARIQPQAAEESAPAVGSRPCHVVAGEESHVDYRCKGTIFEAYDCHVGDSGAGDGEEEVEGNVWEGEGEGNGVCDVDYGDCWAFGRKRRGDLGWYRYQDLTALNGSVVRLWEEERRMAFRLGSRLVA